jgi:hypothetical protein
LKHDRAIAEAGDGVEFAAEGFDEAADGAELQIIPGFHLRKGDVTG